MAGEGSLGTIRGQMILDIRQAIAAYTAVRLMHLNTMTALVAGGAALTAAGAGLAGVGIAIGAGLAIAVKAAADFERKLDYFAAVSDSTQAEYDAIREKALQLGQDTIYSAGEIADSFVELGKAGVKAKDIIDGIGEGVANLGAAADIPLDTAATIIMSAVQTFGLSADSAVMVADKLAGAANASIVEVQDLGLSMKYAGGVASALGISFEDTNTALALLGKYGIRGSTAGTSLRQILVSLGGATEKATKQLKELGIITDDGKNKFFDEAGNAKSLAEVFQILQEATAGMGEEQKLAALKAVFATRALPSVIALSKEGAEGFATMATEINKTTAMEVASKRLDNLSGDLEILRGNLETLAIESGSQLQDFARGIVQGLTDIVQWFTNLSDSTQGTILKILAFSAALFTVVGILGIFAGSVLSIIGLGMRIYQAFQLLAAGIKIVTAAVWAQNAAWLANPITWIILAVVALVAAFVLLWRNNEGFRNFFIKMWEGIKKAATAVVDWFKNLPKWFSDTWNSIKDTATNVWNNIIAFFKRIPQYLLQGFLNFTLPGLLIKHWDTIKNTATNAWNNVVEFFKSVPSRIVEVFRTLPYQIGYWISYAVAFVIRIWFNAWKFIITTVWDAIQAVAGFLASLPGRIAAYFTQVWNDTVNIWNNIYSFFTSTVPTIVGNIIKWLSELPAKAGAFFGELYSKAVSWLQNTASSAGSLAQRIWSNIVSFVQQLPGNIATFFGQVAANVRTWLGQAVDTARTMGSNIYNGIRDAITGLPGLVGGILGRVIDAVKGMVRSAFNAVKDFAAGLWDGFRDGLGIHSPSFIERAMWAITDVVSDEAQHLKGQVPRIQKLGAQLDNMSFGYTANDSLAYSASQFAQQLAAYKKMEANLVKTASTASIGPNASMMTTSGALGSRLGSSAQALPPDMTANVQVFVGDREITDIVDTRVDVVINDTALGVQTGTWS